MSGTPGVAMSHGADKSKAPCQSVPVDAGNRRHFAGLEFREQFDHRIPWARRGHVEWCVAARTQISSGAKRAIATASDHNSENRGVVTRLPQAGSDASQYLIVECVPLLRSVDRDPRNSVLVFKENRTIGHSVVP